MVWILKKKEIGHRCRLKEDDEVNCRYDKTEQNLDVMRGRINMVVIRTQNK